MEDFETGSTDIESGATEGASPDASSSESNNGGEAAEAAAPETKQPDTTPFHEHPRFKELVEQKNEALKRYQDMESRYKQIEQQISSLKEAQPKAPSEFDQLIEDLKKVDPRLAAALETQAKAAQQAQTLQQRLDAFERQQQESARAQQVQTAVAKINSMHESNKASPEVRQFINDKLDLLYMQGKLNLQNLDQTYKEQYDAIKKYEDALTRSIRESYVQAKTKDAQVPASQPRGTPAKPAPKKPQFSNDKETAKAQIVSRYLKQSAANREADSV